MQVIHTPLSTTLVYYQGSWPCACAANMYLQVCKLEVELHNAGTCRRCRVSNSTADLHAATVGGRCDAPSAHASVAHHPPGLVLLTCMH